MVTGEDVAVIVVAARGMSEKHNICVRHLLQHGAHYKSLVGASRQEITIIQQQAQLILGDVSIRHGLKIPVVKEIQEWAKIEI